MSLHALWARLLGRRPITDPWQRTTQRFSLRQFGPGATHDFAWYFEGASAVSVATIDDIEAWLRGCAYVGDRELFREEDLWLHPLTFEELRRGDCEDHALWAWRKLVELGLEAWFVVGYLREPGAAPIRHAWVAYTQNGDTHIFEATAPEGRPMRVRLAEVATVYWPQLGVDRERNPFAYAGYLGEPQG